MATAETGGGLSPRVRGKRLVLPRCLSKSGSIPACAGETALSGVGDVVLTVYPRVCGGNRWRWRCRLAISGLSPRVRGKRTPHRNQILPPGSIPACAGETHARVSAGTFARVYPRVCGGNHLRDIVKTSPAGLSPRVRGKPPASCCRSSSGWSIPACAGETYAFDATPYMATVYPRVCGGNRFLSQCACSASGLSPRVRGKRIDSDATQHIARSIPACAGETRKTARKSGRGRSIPACAGETRPVPGRPCRRWVYPRVCGGNLD